ncbi:hypothetical protein KY285_003501 [Solanum tuberosum]|nr:hypothetical protein KY284_003654 [Solanum tuberosum]KAH0732658.1 hypothetical protein KY289_003846 [Solanum tuberosum]KAH0767630.1 hypothetical protein KY285_003501 [Solanum tuberosum]
MTRRHSVNRPPTPDTRDEQENEPTLKEIINIKLIESGEKERLMELLRERLVESGWKDEMKALLKCNSVYYIRALHSRGACGSVLLTRPFHSPSLIADLPHPLDPKWCAARKAGT